MHLSPATADPAAANALIGIGHTLLIGQLLTGQWGGISTADTFAVLVVMWEMIDIFADLTLIVAAALDALPFVHRLALSAPFAAIKAVSVSLIGFQLHKLPFMPEYFT